MLVKKGNVTWWQTSNLFLYTEVEKVLRYFISAKVGVHQNSHYTSCIKNLHK